MKKKEFKTVIKSKKGGDSRSCHQILMISVTNWRRLLFK